MPSETVISFLNRANMIRHLDVNHRSIDHDRDGATWGHFCRKLISRRTFKNISIFVDVNQFAYVTYDDIFPLTSSPALNTR